MLQECWWWRSQRWCDEGGDGVNDSGGDGNGECNDDGGCEDNNGRGSDGGDGGQRNITLMLNIRKSLPKLETHK